MFFFSFLLFREFKFGRMQKNVSARCDMWKAVLHGEVQQNRSTSAEYSVASLFDHGTNTVVKEGHKELFSVP